MSDLFKFRYSEDKLHPSFLAVATRPQSSCARLMMEEVFAEYIDTDGNFVEQFQTHGFDNRVFELYVFQLLRSEGVTLDQSYQRPDFCGEKDGIRFFVECTTANPRDTGDGKIKPYSPIDPRANDKQYLWQLHHQELPIKFGSALYSKYQKKYWELDHVKGHPFILAIQTFHDNDSLSSSASPLSTYLYGLDQKPTWDEQGNLVIVDRAVERHTQENKEIPSGFFNLPDAENISAVLWSNSGTAAKFTRMGYQGKYYNPELQIIRYGMAYDPDPNAHRPVPFVYFVDDPFEPETWGQSAYLFKNANAVNPIPDDFFPSLIEAYQKDGRLYTSQQGFHAIVSHTYNLRGSRKHAMIAFHSLVETLKAADLSTDYPDWIFDEKPPESS